ncbi:hypothetical protein J5N97_018101 [Dioscorea zingiberensis]|uniref:Uncharacterized protein n=1 Tax=Dioscorea zingiberensis TaxID=325984 RepID=A0A9D5CML6_9LILI|nr:hypothetical protein J5N97_018101 [Dioscorea zingiberensis]
MGEWKRASSWKSSRGHNGPPKHWRPPLHPGSWDTNIPWWERKFLAYVSPIPLEELNLARSSMSIYKNVLEWDDSAALEAFQKAKSRFWAKINGLRSDVSLPDPDMYIDEVNHDAIIDPELIEDLYKEPPEPANQDVNENVGLNYSIFTDKPIPATGWDDAEEPASSSAFPVLPQSANWDVHIEKPTRLNAWSDANNHFPPCCTNAAEQQYSGWDVNADYSNAWNPVNYEGNGDRGNKRTDGFMQNEEWVNNQDNMWDNRINKSWGPCQSNYDSGGRYSRKRYRGRFGSGQMNSRFQADDHQRNNNWRNCRGRNHRIHPSEHTFYNRQPTSQMWDSRC